MKVMHVLSSSNYSGAENVVCQIIKMFDRLPEYEMIYCSCEGPISDILAEKRIKYVPIRDITISEVKRVVNEEKPDVVHAHDMRASLICALSCGEVKLVSHIHNNHVEARRISVRSVAYILPAVKANRIIWVSESAYIGYVFHWLFSKKSVVLRNIIDSNALIKKAEEDKTDYNYDIVYLGRLTDVKNPLRMVDIVSDVCKIRPNTKVAIIGDGDLKIDVENKISDKGLENNIVCFGYKNNPYKILKSSKVMIMTSRREGLPMVALEALSLGVPIVSTPVDGLLEILSCNKAGYLSENDDDLKKKILDILNSDIGKIMSNEALKLANEINDLDNYKNEIIRSYN